MVLRGMCYMFGISTKQDFIFPTVVLLIPSSLSIVIFLILFVHGGQTF